MHYDVKKVTPLTGAREILRSKAYLNIRCNKPTPLDARKVEENPMKRGTDGHFPKAC